MEFSQALDEAGDGDLIAHFRKLPRTRWPHEPNGARVGLDEGLGCGEGSRIAACHDGQDPILGTRLAAGNRTIEEFEAAAVGCG